MLQLKTYLVDVFSDCEYVNLPAKAEFSMSIADAEWVIGLSRTVKENRAHMIELFDFRVNYLSYTPSDDDDSTEASKGNRINTEVDCLCVGENAFWFSCYLKHGDAQIKTAQCSIGDLAAYFGLQIDSMPTTNGNGVSIPDAVDVQAKHERSHSSNRNVFVEILMSNELSISDPEFVGGRESIQFKQYLVAGEVMEAMDQHEPITRTRYDSDPVFAKCIHALSPLATHYPDHWEGRTIQEFRLAFCSRLDNTNTGTIAFSAKTPNKFGVHARYITLGQLNDAQPLGASGWLLPDGNELWFFRP